VSNNIEDLEPPPFAYFLLDKNECHFSEKNILKINVILVEKMSVTIFTIEQLN
jgi:hypothetical protein